MFESNVEPLNQLIEIEPIKLVNESFKIDDREITLLNGTYSIKRYVNPNTNLSKVMKDYWIKNQAFPGYRLYMLGNILYKLDEPKIEDMIDLIIRCTHAEQLPDYVDTDVIKANQIRGPPFCRGKRVIFRFEGKLFTLYRRYVYGYLKPYVTFLNNEVAGNADDEDDDDDDYDFDYYAAIRAQEKIRRKALLTREEIVVPTVAGYDKNIPMGKFNYAFSIKDEKTGVLCAFASFR